MNDGLSTFQNFFQQDGKAGQQFKLAGSLAGSMMGGLAGSMFLFEGDLFSKTVTHDDGSKSVQNLIVDKKSGLMNYSEWEMPSFPSFPGSPSTSSAPQPAQVSTLDTSTGIMTPATDNDMLFADNGHGTHLQR